MADEKCQREKICTFYIGYIIGFLITKSVLEIDFFKETHVGSEVTNVQTLTRW